MSCVQATPRLTFVLGVLSVLAAGPANAAEPSEAPPDAASLRAMMMEAKDYLFERAVHPTTHLIYGGIDLEDPDRWKNTVFPTPESIRNRFCDDSEQPSVSNCPISNGVFLGALVDCYDVTQSPACIEQARTVFDGLRTLARVSKRKGFVARGVLPVDGKTHLLNSSVDQYTFYVYALWKYFHSPMAGEAERKDIRQIMGEICTMIEADGTILATNGIPAPVSDIEAIRSDRSSRLLEVYLVGYDVTGDAHWLEKYREKRDESSRARVRSLLDPHRVKYPYVPRDEERDLVAWGAIWQTQYSLVPLVNLEEDAAVRAAYVEAMRLNARLVESGGRDTHGHGLEVVVMAAGRGPAASARTPHQARRTAALAGKCRRHLVRRSRSTGALALYWTAVKRGIL